MDYEAAIATFWTTAPEGTPVPDAVTQGGPARRLRDALEPLAMHAAWSREVYDVLAERGLNFLSAYVYGRGAALGEVPPSLVSSSFAVFAPELIDELWTQARATLDRAELIRLRTEGTTSSLRKVLEDVTDDGEVLHVAEALERAADAADGAGRPLFSALRAAPRPTDPYARLWRAAELAREHRGDGHVACCLAAGLRPCEMNIVTELWLGYPLGEYSNTRGWSKQETDNAIAHLTVTGLIKNWELTEDGHAFRRAIEDRTDASQRTLVTALGDDLERIIELTSAWSGRCTAAGFFPADPRKRAAG